jgi:catechol 2,3-dioxygenase-like lactoylglutathione lyase family enzyme
VTDAERLHHVFVLTDDVEGTRAFYCDVLGFEVAEKPPLPFPGCWLTLGGDACVHLGERAGYEAWSATLGLAPTPGPADHVAFRRDGYEELSARLEAAGVAAVRNEVPGAFRQIYVTDPNGLRIELNVPL